MAANSSVLPDFQAWMESMGIRYSDAVRLVGAAEGCSGLALGVKATRDIAEGERLCTIPKAACISIRTTELADVIQTEELGGGLGLVLAVLHEMSLGSDSKWHGYFQALPAREYVPLFWNDNELGLLQGTELEEQVESDRQLTAEDFEESILPLLEKYPGRLRPEGITLGSFHIAASFVSSRAFGVDDWHGDAMVPLADIFNHKASVVELGEGYEVHGAASDSDESEGEEEETDGEEDEGEDGEEENKEGMQAHSSNGEGDGAEEEQAASGNGTNKRQEQHRHSHTGCGSGERGHTHKHGQSDRHVVAEEREDDEAGDGAAAVWPAVISGGPACIYGLETANGLHLRLEMSILDPDEDTLEIVAASAVPGGAEVHNTYGELGNAELVKKYGFALRQNPFTAVALDKRRLLAAASKALGARRWKARSKLLREQTNVLEEEEELFEALPNGHISPSLFVALRVLGASDAELASWDRIADALQLPPVRAGAAGGGSGAGEQQQDEGDEEAHLGAVQVWPVLDSAGQPLPEAAGPAAVAGAAAGASAQGSGSLQGGAHAAMLPSTMWVLLQEEVEQRQAAYAAPLQADLQQLDSLEQRAQQVPSQGAQQQQGAAAAAGAGSAGKGKAAAAIATAAAPVSSERQAAERAALLLRITEKEVLRDLLLALERRLAAMDAGEEGKEAAGEKAAAGGKAGKAKGTVEAAAAGGSSAGRKRKQR